MPLAGNEFQLETPIQIESRNQLCRMILKEATLIAGMYSKRRTSPSQGIKILQLCFYTISTTFFTLPPISGIFLPLFPLPGMYFSAESTWVVLPLCLLLLQWSIFQPVPRAHSMSLAYNEGFVALPTDCLNA